MVDSIFVLVAHTSWDSNTTRNIPRPLRCIDRFWKGLGAAKNHLESIKKVVRKDRGRDIILGVRWTGNCSMKPESPFDPWKI